jgi:general secretion pathway protein N
MRATALATLFALALTVMLVALCPAAWVLRQAEAHSGSRFAAFEETGTAWAGSARLAFSTPAGKVTIERVSWRLSPASLLGGRLGFHVEANAGGLRAAGVVARGLDGWSVHDASASGDASALSTLTPLAAAWKPEGKVEVIVPRAFLDGARLRGQAEIVWRDASLALSAVKPLGTYRLELAAEGGPAQVTLATLAGTLRLAGRGTFAPPAAFTLSGDARAEGPAAAAVEPMLDLIGPKRPDGARALELRTR